MGFVCLRDERDFGLWLRLWLLLCCWFLLQMFVVGVFELGGRVGSLPDREEEIVSTYIGFVERGRVRERAPCLLLGSCQDTCPSNGDIEYLCVFGGRLILFYFIFILNFLSLSLFLSKNVEKLGRRILERDREQLRLNEQEGACESHNLFGWLTINSILYFFKVKLTHTYSFITLFKLTIYQKSNSKLFHKLKISDTT